jgi:hypothetical protein
VLAYACPASAPHSNWLLESTKCSARRPGEPYPGAFALARPSLFSNVIDTLRRNWPLPNIDTVPIRTRPSVICQKLFANSSMQASRYARFSGLPLTVGGLSKSQSTLFVRLTVVTLVAASCVTLFRGWLAAYPGRAATPADSANQTAVQASFLFKAFGVFTKPCPGGLQRRFVKNAGGVS